MTIIIYLLLISMLFYIGILLWFIAGNIFLKSAPDSLDTPPVSVIIAIRNGEDTLPHLLADLYSQDYSGDMEFIVVDDESEDLTKKIIQGKSSVDKRFKYESSTNGDHALGHKKRALDAGIKRADHEWLLFTDADCCLKSSWVRGMVSHFNQEVDYVVGYSEVERGTRLVTRFQSFDFLMLMIAARGTTNSGKAWASSGQNQAYRKSLFEMVEGYSQIADKLQGDDSLFLQICRKQNSAKVIFADKPECRTIARQEKTWRAFIKQRMRWAGDANIMWEFNVSFFLSILTTFLLPLLLLVTFFAGIIHDPYYFTVFVKFLTLHFIFEYILYFVGVRQLAKPIQFIDFCLWFIIHIPYIVLMGIGSFFANQLIWRER